MSWWYFIISNFISNLYWKYDIGIFLPSKIIYKSFPLARTLEPHVSLYLIVFPMYLHDLCKLLLSSPLWTVLSSLDRLPCLHFSHAFPYCYPVPDAELYYLTCLISFIRIWGNLEGNLLAMPQLVAWKWVTEVWLCCGCLKVSPCHTQGHALKDEGYNPTNPGLDYSWST